MFFVRGVNGVELGLSVGSEETGLIGRTQPVDDAFFFSVARCAWRVRIVAAITGRRESSSLEPSIRGDQ